MYLEYQEKLWDIWRKIGNLQSDAYDTLDLPLKDKDQISTRLYIAKRILEDIDNDIIADEAEFELEMEPD